MQTFKVKVSMVSDYIQHRFSEDAKDNLKVRAGSKAKIEDDDSWKEFLYSDEGGVFIPSNQIRESLVAAGKSTKMKGRSSFKEYAQSYFIVQPEKIYVGKQEPDYIKESFVQRKDGLRVRLIRPAFTAGLTFEFMLKVLTDDIDQKSIGIIITKAGMEKGIGAWRAGGHGRFEMLELDKI
jgi:hypothetical protein